MWLVFMGLALDLHVALGQRAVCLEQPGMAWPHSYSHQRPHTLLDPRQRGPSPS